MKRTQSDKTERVVCLSNLEAMCERISGMCHKFEVVKVVGTYSVHVQYSNPNEYGTPEPVTAVYPAFPNAFDGKDNPFVVLHAVRYIGATGRNEESWQAFFQLTDCEPLFRTSSDSNDWETRFEIMVAKHPDFRVGHEWDRDGVIQTWTCKDKSFRSWRDAQAWACEQMTTLQTAQTV